MTNYCHRCGTHTTLKDWLCELCWSKWAAGVRK